MSTPKASLQRASLADLEWCLASSLSLFLTWNEGRSDQVRYIEWAWTLLPLDKVGEDTHTRIGNTICVRVRNKGSTDHVQMCTRDHVRSDKQVYIIILPIDRRARLLCPRATTATAGKFPAFSACASVGFMTTIRQWALRSSPGSVCQHRGTKKN